MLLVSTLSAPVLMRILYYVSSDKFLFMRINKQVGPLAQSVERRADNAKVVSSRLTWTIFCAIFKKKFFMI